MSTLAQSCPHCQSDQLYTKLEPPHIALRCAACRSWIKWVKRSEADNYPREPAADRCEPAPNHPEPLLTITPIAREAEPIKIDMRRITHPKSIEERIASLEHDVALIAQVFVGTARREAQR